VTRNAGAKWFIPSENEWYKAAYYQPAAKGGDADSYWSQPMKTNSEPYSAVPPGNAAPDNTRVANINTSDGVANGYDDGYAATGSGVYSPTQNFLTDVGAYTFSASYYGTFDQGGSVWEWNEAQVFGAQRGIRGGSWNDVTPYTGVTIRGQEFPTHDYNTIGFRVATAIVPEPDVAALVGAMSGLGLLWRRRASR
jgi:formylglycine-generating enzyme required for sulfatase activity